MKAIPRGSCTTGALSQPPPPIPRPRSPPSPTGRPFGVGAPGAWMASDDLFRSRRRPDRDERTRITPAGDKYVGEVKPDGPGPVRPPPLPPLPSPLAAPGVDPRRLRHDGVRQRRRLHWSVSPPLIVIPSTSLGRICHGRIFVTGAFLRVRTPSVGWLARCVPGQVIGSTTSGTAVASCPGRSKSHLCAHVLHSFLPSLLGAHLNICVHDGVIHSEQHEIA